MNRRASRDGIRECISKTGAIRYEARINRVGEKSISKRFATRKAALEWKRGMDTDIDRGTPTVSGKTVLVRQVIDDYLAYRKASRTPLPSNQITEYERVKLDLGTYAVGKLDRSDIENWLKLLLNSSRGTYKDGRDKGPYAPASVRKFFYAFKVAVDWHTSEYHYRVSDFLFKLHKGSVPGAWEGKRERRLATGEEARLYAAGIERADTYTTADWQAIIGFALETALREQELVWARWIDLRQGNARLYVPATHSKTKTSRVVLLSETAQSILLQQQASCPEGESRIFHQVASPTALCDAFARLTQRAKAIDLHFHDLRHEATSRLCESGEHPMPIIMKMTGHSSMTTFGGYVHLFDEGY